MKKSILFVVLLLTLMQLIGIDKTNPDVDLTTELKVPEDIGHLLEKSCYDCHSNKTVWPGYADIAPVSFFVASHVEDGRKALNFSNWDNIPKDIKIARLKRSIITVKNGMMPLSSYLWMHKEAKLTSNEQSKLAAWFQAQLKKYE